MEANQNMARSRLAFNHHPLVVMLGSVVINAFRRLNQKPNQIQHNRTYKVEYDLINNVAGNDAGVVKYHVTDGILHTNNEWQNGVLNSTENTHNRYSTIRREKYKCLNESLFITKLAKLQTWNVNLTSAFLLRGAF